MTNDNQTPRTITATEELPARAARKRSDEALTIIDPAHYELRGEVARGGTGRILAAVDVRLGRDVAIKEPLGAGPSHERRFVREARITSLLQHPAIVPVYEVGRWPSGTPFYAMKLVRGRSLREIIDATPTLADRLLLVRHVESVADAMGYAHERGVIHRDLKPSNVLVGPFGETVVIDWGLAKDLDDAPGGAGDDDTAGLAAGGASAPATDAAGTRTGAVLGTPGYMPPEQARGERVDERADVYALGALLYHVVAGVMPNRGATSDDMVQSVLRGPPPPLASVARGAPRELVDIVERAMDRDPARRYPSAREIAEELRRYAQRQRVLAHRYSAWELLRRFSTRHQSALLASTLSLAVLLAVLVVSIARINAARADAERERAGAEHARKDAQARGDALVLAKAADVLERDPTASIAWLLDYPAGAPGWPRARAIADDARSRGVALHVVDDAHVVAASADGARIAIGTAARAHAGDAAVSVCDVGPATLRCRALQGAGAGAADGAVGGLAFSPDGALLATSIGAGFVQLWDANSLGPPSAAAVPPAMLAAHFKDSVPGSIAFSPDGKKLMAIGPWGVRIVAVADGALEEHPIGADPGGEQQLSYAVYASDGAHIALQWEDDARPGFSLLDLKDGSVIDLGAVPLNTDVIFAPDGRTVAAVTNRNDIELWQVPPSASSTKAQVRTLSGEDKRLTAIAFSADGASLATASDDEIWLWDLATGTHRTLGAHPSYVDLLSFSRMGALASAAQDGSVKLWDTAGGDARTYVGHKGVLSAIGFLRDAARDGAGPQLFSLGSDETLRVWPAPTSSPSFVFARLPDKVRDVGFSSDGARVGAAGGGVARVCSAAIGSAVPDHDEDACVSLHGKIARLAFAPGGGNLVVAFGDEARLWDVATGAARVLWSQDDSIQAAAFSPDGARVALATGFDRRVHIFDTAGAKETATIELGAFTKAVAFSPAGDALLCGGDIGALGIWRVSDGHVDVLQKLVAPKLDIYQVAWSPDGARVASAGEGGDIALFDVAGGAPRLLRGHKDSIFDLRFSPDGAWLASASGDTTARLWRTAGDEVRVLAGHTAPVWRLAFSPASDALATVSRDGTLRVWSVATGEGEVMRGHAGEVRNVAFSPDGRRVVTGSWDRTARVWSLDGLRAIPASPDDARALLATWTTARIVDDGERVQSPR